ncbi:MAG: GNAT family N-acetyltransferase [Terracidiphilus sp.]
MTIRRLQGSSDPDFENLSKIYVDAHPPSERKSVETLRSMADRLDYSFTVAAEKGKVLGFSIVLCFSGSDACLLEYMAVAGEARNRGIGGRLFRAVVASAEVAARFVLVEVDSGQVPCQDAADRARRMSFYRKLGCREIEGLRYLMPPVSSAAPPPMELLVYKKALPPSVESAHVRAWLEACYTQVYSRPAHDPHIEAMLRDLPNNLRLI